MGTIMVKCRYCGTVTNEVKAEVEGVLVMRGGICKACDEYKRKRAEHQGRKLDSMYSMHYERQPYTLKDYWNDFTNWLAYWIAKIYTSISSFFTGR